MTVLQELYLKWSRTILDLASFFLYHHLMKEGLIKTCQEDFVFPLKEFPFDIYSAKGAIRSLHYLHKHDFLEVNWVCDGKGINYINQNSYQMKKNDLFLISNRDSHMAISDGTLSMIIITFSPTILGETSSFRYDYLSPFFSKAYFSGNTAIKTECAKKINKLIVQIKAEWENKRMGYQLIIRGYLMVLLSIFVREFNKVQQSEFVQTTEDEFFRILPSLNYMKNNFKETIKLEQLAIITNMSSHYYCECFKNLMGISPLHYLEMIRINEACFLLKTTTNSVTEVCFNCGYYSLSTFNHAFKRLCGVSPLQYRKNLQSIRKI